MITLTTGHAASYPIGSDHKFKTEHLNETALDKLLGCPCEKESAEECCICRDLDTRKSMISMENVIRGIDKVGFNVATRVRLVKAIQEEGGLM